MTTSTDFPAVQQSVLTHAQSTKQVWEREEGTEVGLSKMLTSVEVWDEEAPCTANQDLPFKLFPDETLGKGKEMDGTDHTVA